VLAQIAAEENRSGEDAGNRVLQIERPGLACQVAPGDGVYRAAAGSAEPVREQPASRGGGEQDDGGELDPGGDQ
jgi:hypothetical protein